ncbi:hypothetical protein XHV734_0388 [Xanthomonas hortorum pv. vitians]|nr:hypothetical protein XHV734_0388 [Xanthomonas hortorum pv. vitians]
MIPTKADLQDEACSRLCSYPTNRLAQSNKLAIHLSKHPKSILTLLALGFDKLT